jgi:UDP-N-acetyl-D-glucosamine dehydrogenase
MDLLKKIDQRKIKIGIIGFGYVGMPLAVEFASAGYTVTGIEINPDKAQSVMKGRSYVGDVPSPVLKKFVKAGKISATTDASVLETCEAAIICVPTPLRKTRDPDISFILAALDMIEKHGRNCRIIVLESTTYPGTSEEILLPRLEQDGRKAGKDFFLAFSPERVDPGNKVYTTKKIPKIIGGITPECTRVVSRLYSKAIDTIIPVSSATVAETCKLLENTFRSVNIGLINEIALMCHKMGINVWEVIDGASTKPFAFMPFYPGPGLGGHCIPIDPLYLSWKAKLAKFTAKFIETADEVNGSMPEHVVARTMDILNMHRKCLKDAKILILGIAYKANVSDTRESPAFEVMKLLRAKGAILLYSDPHAPRFIDEENHFDMESKKLSAKLLKKVDCAIIITNHKKFNYPFIIKNSPLVFDTRNATKLSRGKAKNVYVL